MNARLFSGDTETVFLMTDPEYSFISSSLIKEVASYGGSVDGLVPEYVVSRIRSKLEEE
jgi:pantetheine-phosphate adenylyltransferase